MPVTAETPIVESLVQRLKDAIESGHIVANRPLPSERKLAETFGVSRTLVRRALTILAGEDWIWIQSHCRPVVNAAKAAARPSMRSTKTDHISVWLWPHVGDFAASSIFRGIQNGFSSSDLQIVIANASGSDWKSIIESEKDFLRSVIDDESCAGAIVYLLGGSESASSLVENERPQTPLVFVDRQPPLELDGDFVGTENVVSAQKAVKHLTELGHRRICCVRNLDDASPVHERVEGYRRALEDAGIAFDGSLIQQPFTTKGEPESGALDGMIQEVMQWGNAPTAFFAINDVLALQLIDRLTKLGWPVPDTVSVVGFDGVLRWHPDGGRLTTVDQAYIQMGELASEMLLNRISGKGPRSFRHILLDSPLRVQGSSGKPRSNSINGPVP